METAQGNDSNTNQFVISHEADFILRFCGDNRNNRKTSQTASQFNVNGLIAGTIVLYNSTGFFVKYIHFYL